MWLSRNFHRREAMCHDGTDLPDHLVPNAQFLAEHVLQPIRDWWGPVEVVSWYRTPKWNRRVGGAEGSTHMTADGADIRPVNHVMLPQFKALICDMYRGGYLPKLGGYGTYRGWVHVDTYRAAHGHLRVWRGKGVGSEQLPKR